MAHLTATHGPAATRTTASWLSLLGRIGAGQIFIFAGLIKVTDPQSVADSIVAFGLLDKDSEFHRTLISLAAYMLPWTEIIAGVLLVMGLFTRAAAGVLFLLMAFFIGLIYKIAIVDGQILTCGCFGDIQLFCKGPLDECNLIQNGVIAFLAFLPLVIGGGRASADALAQRPVLLEEPDTDEEGVVFE